MPVFKIKNENGEWVPIISNVSFGGENIKLDQSLSVENMAADAKAVGDALYNMTTIIDSLQSQMSDLLYKEITITSFTNNGNTTTNIENGNTIENIVLSWETSKQPKSIVLSDSTGYSEKLNISDKTKSLTNATITSDITWTLTVKDERNTVATKTTKLSFVNGIYYGIITDGTTIDSDIIRNLTKKVQNNRNATFTANVGTGARIIYAIPSNGYGNPIFVDYNSKYGVDMYLAKENFSFTNDYNYTTNYNIWVSTEIQKNDITVVVS